MIPWTENAAVDIQRYALVSSRQVEAQTYSWENTGVVSFV